MPAVINKQLESTSSLPAETTGQPDLESITVDDVIIGHDGTDSPVVEESPVTPQRKPNVEKPQPVDSVIVSSETIEELVETAQAPSEVIKYGHCDAVFYEKCNNDFSQKN